MVVYGNITDFCRLVLYPATFLHCWVCRLHSLVEWGFKLVSLPGEEVESSPQRIKSVDEGLGQIEGLSGYLASS